MVAECIVPIIAQHGAEMMARVRDRIEREGVDILSSSSPSREGGEEDKGMED